jgi:ABC-type dipeptide/oligopeptide/nickel transport system permease component
MPSSKTKESKKSQSNRFIDAAREAGASEDEAVFDETLKRILLTIDTQLGFEVLSS